MSMRLSLQTSNRVVTNGSRASIADTPRCWTYSSRSLASYLTILPSRIVYSIRARRS